MATRPINTARTTTVLARPDVVISSTTRPASTGVATVSSEPMTLSTMNQDSARRCGRAKARIRRNVCSADGPPPALAVDRALHRHPVAEIHLHRCRMPNSSPLEVNEPTVSLGTLPR